MVNAFPLKLGTRQSCLLSPLLFDTIVKPVQKARNKRHPDWKEKCKTIIIPWQYDLSI